MKSYISDDTTCKDNIHNNTISYEEKIELKSKILQLSKDDWKSICTCILIPNNEKITINKGGGFLCLMNISDKSIIKIKKYIKHKKNITI